MNEKKDEQQAIRKKNDDLTMIFLSKEDIEKKTPCSNCETNNCPEDRKSKQVCVQFLG